MSKTSSVVVTVVSVVVSIAVVVVTVGYGVTKTKCINFHLNTNTWNNGDAYEGRRNFRHRCTPVLPNRRLDHLRKPVRNVS